MPKKVIAKVKKVLAKRKKAPVKKAVVAVPCGTCSATGLLNSQTLCPACAGTGTRR